MPDHAVSTDPAVQRQLDRLWALSPGADILGLERITALLDRVGNPQDRLPPVLHVAGTNGKGSTCAFLRAAIEAAGYAVHVYSSPHLVRFNERIRLAGRLIEDAELAPLLAEVLDAGGDIGASFFEVTTAAAFLAFARTPADACILEVGLGGRLDATNVVPRPIVTGIAQLGIDHQHFLGDTIEDIAAEKAGIAKPQVPLVTMRYAPSVEARIRQVARIAGAPVSPAGQHWFWEADGDHVSYRDAAGRVQTPLPTLAGPHQPGNLALAIAMLHHQNKLAIPPEAFASAATDANWPARMQRLGDGPLTRLLPAGSDVWLDGGHNAAAGESVAEALRGILECHGGTRAHLIVGMLSNKDPAGLLRPFAGLGASFHAVPVPAHEHHDSETLDAVAREIGIEPQSAETVSAALQSIADADTGPVTVMILGSLYLAGEVLAANEQAPD